MNYSTAHIRPLSDLISFNSSTTPPGRSVDHLPSPGRKALHRLRPGEGAGLLHINTFRERSGWRTGGRTPSPNPCFLLPGKDILRQGQLAFKLRHSTGNNTTQLVQLPCALEAQHPRVSPPTARSELSGAQETQSCMTQSSRCHSGLYSSRAELKPRAHVLLNSTDMKTVGLGKAQFSTWTGGIRMATSAGCEEKNKPASAKCPAHGHYSPCPQTVCV